MKPLVSIIVPVYNVENYINKCINSLINQDYKDFEIILINDGSTDNSGQICDNYSKQYENIRVFHIKNRGVSNARNFGIQKSKGEYIQFVDSDDFVNENYVSCMINQVKNRNIDLVICGINQVNYKEGIITEYNEIISKYEGIYNKNKIIDIMYNLVESSYINYCYSKLIKKEIIKENNIRFEKNISLGEDTLFVLELLKYSNNISIISNAPYNYIIHSNQSLTYKYRYNKFDILNRLSNNIYSFFYNEKLLNEKLIEVLDKRYLEIIKFCLDENFKRHEGIKFSSKLKIMKEILNNDDVIKFINSDKKIFYDYNNLLIQSIRTKNEYIYCLVYYIIIIKNKLKEV